MSSAPLDELLARSPLDLRGVGEEVLHRAVFAEELLCALLTDTLTAGDVVYLVPEECEVVDDLCGRVEAELLPYLGFAPRSRSPPPCIGRYIRTCSVTSCP